MKAVNILIAVQHPIFCAGIKRVLANEPVFKIKGTANNAKELLGLAIEEEAILVLDLGKTDSETTAIIDKLIDRYPTLKIITLRRKKDSTNVKQVMQAGAFGYIFKKNSTHDLIKGLKDIRAGEKYVCEEAFQQLIGTTGRSYNGNGNTEELTQRETEILSLICDELTNREISEKLCISVRTVDTHRRNILQKTGAKNTAGMVKYAIRNQVFPL